MPVKDITIIVNCVMLITIITFFIILISINKKQERTILEEQLDFINGYICGVGDKKTNYEIQNKLLFYDEVAKRLYSQKLDKKKKILIIKYLEKRRHSLPGRRKR